MEILREMGLEPEKPRGRKNNGTHGITHRQAYLQKVSRTTTPARAAWYIPRFYYPLMPPGMQTAERRTLNQQYLSLKDEVKQAERIRKSVASILRQEQREQQPYKTQDMDK